jgi:hypothetical protein
MVMQFQIHFKQYNAEKARMGHHPCVLTVLTGDGYYLKFNGTNIPIVGSQAPIYSSLLSLKGIVARFLR